MGTVSVMVTLPTTLEDPVLGLPETATVDHVPVRSLVACTV
jgi:hypothetical protein